MQCRLHCTLAGMRAGAIAASACVSASTSAVECAAVRVILNRAVPAGTVGGDFFAISALSETEAGVFICDVAGHGVRSALVTAMIRALAEAEGLHGHGRAVEVRK